MNIDLFQEEILCRKVLVATVEKNETFIDSIIDINKYSDFLKLLRITSLVYRFVDNLKKKVSKKSVILCKYVTTNERRNAKLLWLKCNQYYLLKENDFQSLKRNKPFPRFCRHSLWVANWTLTPISETIFAGRLRKMAISFYA